MIVFGVGVVGMVCQFLSELCLLYSYFWLSSWLSVLPSLVMPPRWWWWSSSSSSVPPGCASLGCSPASETFQHPCQAESSALCACRSSVCLSKGPTIRPVPSRPVRVPLCTPFVWRYRGASSGSSLNKLNPSTTPLSYRHSLIGTQVYSFTHTLSSVESQLHREGRGECVGSTGRAEGLCLGN